MATRVVATDTNIVAERDGDDVGFTSATLAYLEDKAISDEEIYNGVKYAEELHHMALSLGKERDRNAWLCGKTLSRLGGGVLSKSTQESVTKILTNLVQRKYDKAKALLDESLRSISQYHGVGMHHRIGGIRVWHVSVPLLGGHHWATQRNSPGKALHCIGAGIGPCLFIKL